ncbi:MAG: arginine--tRNA ligase [Candidatus Xiphinematobacter sp.]|nr:MAG: arginine--tRNA ligase [Candidatus Xiphinematobacter sp.]
MNLSLREELMARLGEALTELGLPVDSIEISPATATHFGDYQSNTAMVLAKSLREDPKTVAAQILSHMDVSSLSLQPKIAGAGFLNFRILDSHLVRHLMRLSRDPRLGVPYALSPRRIVIDFSSPNVAKPMHVGHIRATVLGDALARIAQFIGHKVITDNHVGDWGTQFGKVIYGWKHFLDADYLNRRPIAELVRLYRKVNRLEEEDPSVSGRVREELVLLQQGSPESLSIWSKIVELSWKEFEDVYKTLDIHFDHRLGESFYNHALSPLVERLLAAGIAQSSRGAVCVFFPGTPKLTDKPCMVRKSDGGFLYATTDLATLEYRVGTWNPDAIWYVAGAPQSLHFQQVFEIARQLGIQAELTHIAFGSILGKDRKMMKTRAGDNVPLADLLQEAITRAIQVVGQKNPSLSTEEKMEVARTIGIGAVKYAELSQNRLTDYVFSWERMLSFQGNTAPYLQNAYVRIRSIFRKLQGTLPEPSTFHLHVPEERVLALRLLQFGETVPRVLEDFRPNLLANYLFGLANAFHSFYEACPVLNVEEKLRQSRLILCQLSERILDKGLSLLGINSPKRM